MLYILVGLTILVNISWYQRQPFRPVYKLSILSLHLSKSVIGLCQKHGFCRKPISVINSGSRPAAFTCAKCIVLDLL